MTRRNQARSANSRALSKRHARGFRSRLEKLKPRHMVAGDAILHWNAVSLQAEANDKSGTFGAADAPGPTGASRALAMVHVAMFDAINSVLGKYEPYLVQVVGVQGANIDAAVGQAAHDVL